MLLPPVRPFAALLLAGLAAAACSSGKPTPAAESRPSPSSSPSKAATGPRPRIVALGDSLTAGYGLSREQAYPALLQRRLDEQGYRYEVVNAGVSGDTSAGGLNRLEWSLEGDVRILIVALGANDGLRGLQASQMKRNLRTIIERAQARRIRVLLAGMEALTNLGPQYRRAFHDVFPELAREYRVAFLPFLLDGIAGRSEYNQADGVHPNAEGARKIADHIWPALEPLLEEPR